MPAARRSPLAVFLVTGIEFLVTGIELGPALLLPALLLSGACASNEPEEPRSTRDALGEESERPMVTLDPEAAKDARSTGLYLADLDRTIRAWQEKTWNAATASDRQRQDQLEIYLENEASKRKDELVVQLETGPDQNRIVAATALGFTRDPGVQSPLLAALDDPNRHVVQNALIGLSLLQDASTPLDRIAELLEDEESNMRASAAYCARCLVEVGADGKAIRREARGGLIDENPIVRSQCAPLLALILRPEPGESMVAYRDDLDAISLLLYDDVPLVRSAAARAIVYVGLEVPEFRGRAARALTGAVDEEDEATMNFLLRNLVLLSERNYGDDLEAWREWADRLP